MHETDLGKVRVNDGIMKYNRDVTREISGSGEVRP
jgi:hypothetical protein